MWRIFMCLNLIWATCPCVSLEQSIVAVLHQWFHSNKTSTNFFPCLNEDLRIIWTCTSTCLFSFCSIFSVLLPVGIRSHQKSPGRFWPAVNPDATSLLLISRTGHGHRRARLKTFLWSREDVKLNWVTCTDENLCCCSWSWSCRCAVKHISNLCTLVWICHVVDS